MKSVYQLIREWAEARNIIQGSTTHAQFCKLVEEFGEVMEAYDAEDIDELSCELGDGVVVLTIIAAQCGFNLEDVGLIEYPDEERDAVYQLAQDLGKSNCPKDSCGKIMYDLHHLADIMGVNFHNSIKRAYAKIEHRKGKMINGVYVKESDL